MYPVSNEFKNYLKEKYMPTWYRSKVVLGAIHQAAQKYAAIQNDNLTDYSSLDILEDLSTNEYYASYEKDHLRVDGSFLFLPKANFKWTGITSEALSDENSNINVMVRITSSAGTPLSIKGITLLFTDDVYAVDFKLLDKNRNVMLSYTKNPNGRFVGNEVYTFDSVMYLHITKLNKPYCRFRLMSLKFGVAVVFESSKIKSLSCKETLQLISTELYALDMSVTIDNQDRQYDIENPSSEINFLEQAQQMDTWLSIELPSGIVEEIKLCTSYLSEWKSNNETATFKGTDRFNFMDGVYEKDIYEPAGVSLYDKAVKVLQDAGLEDDEYVIDSYLKTVMTKNPLPAGSHKECLQLIANAGRCVMKQDRNGNIVLSTSFVPEVEVRSEDKAIYSNLDHLFDENAKETYATFEQDFTTLDGEMKFLPKHCDYYDAGYVSASISGEYCMYTSKPHLLLEFEAPTSLYSIHIRFGQEIASDFIITTYIDDAQVETIAFTSNKDKDFIHQYMFKECNKMLITFTKSSKPRQKTYVHMISFDTVTDKYITVNDISRGTLEGTKLETIKQLNMVRTIYTPAVEITTEEVRVTKNANDEKETVVSYSDPMYKAQVFNGTSDITKRSSAWNVEVDLDVSATGSIEYVLQLKGRKLNLTQQTIVYPLNATGVIKTVENPLIDGGYDMKVGEWIADYLKSDREYNLSYAHGDPSLETGDIIHQENRFNENETQIYNHELSIAGAVSGKLNTRKVVR